MKQLVTLLIVFGIVQLAMVQSCEPPDNCDVPNYCAVHSTQDDCVATKDCKWCTLLPPFILTSGCFRMEDAPCNGYDPEDLPPFAIPRVSPQTVGHPVAMSEEMTPRAIDALPKRPEEAIGFKDREGKLPSQTPKGGFLQDHENSGPSVAECLERFYKIEDMTDFKNRQEALQVLRRDCPNLYFPDLPTENPPENAAGHHGVLQ